MAQFRICVVASIWLACGSADSPNNLVDGKPPDGSAVSDSTASRDGSTLYDAAPRDAGPTGDAVKTVDATISSMDAGLTDANLADAGPCAQGYQGVACDQCAADYYEYPPNSGQCIADPCSPNPCGNHATACENDTGLSVCVCESHYQGATCESCALGYTGNQCEQCDTGFIVSPQDRTSCVVDPCVPDPCNGNGSCSNATGSAVCTCDDKWTGSNCSTCEEGFGGNDCQTNLDDCANTPCKNAGTCEDGVASFTCTCKGAWAGTTCEDLYYGPSANLDEALLPDTVASCHEDSFLDLSNWLPDPNPAYADPALSISCSGNTMSVVSNSVPQYLIDWDDPSRTSFATTLVPTTSTYSIPRTPAFNAVPKQATVVGGVGVAINGVQISSPSASGGPLKYADPESIEVDGDLCDGHPNPSGKYHYHSMRTSCLFPNADDGNSVGDACTAPSPIIGYIADGYPILGPCECLDAACTQVVEMRSSWTLAGGDDDPSSCAYQDYQYTGAASGEESDGDQYLDECSGHYGPSGDYHYHITNEYPWTLRCYRGNPMGTQTAGKTYNNSAGTADCCFEKQCEEGVYQNVTCQMASCVP